MTGLGILLIVAVALFAIALIRKPHGIGPALRDARGQMLVFGLRMPLALLSAAFVSIIVPPTLVAPYIGPESGLAGILIATLFGAIVPGGPILTFPLALVIWRAGAGEAQMVTFLASWSIFAMHRIISYELPLLGGRFVLLRLASSWMLPLVAGLLALALVPLFGSDAPR